jgi:hypothetical protein
MKPGLTFLWTLPPIPRVFPQNRRGRGKVCSLLPTYDFIHRCPFSIVNSLFDSLRSNGHDDLTTFPDEDSRRNSGNYLHSKHSKRRRTVSPASAKRDLEARRLERETRKQRRREQDLNARRQERDVMFLNELYAEIPDLETNGEPLKVVLGTP